MSLPVEPVRERHGQIRSPAESPDDPERERAALRQTIDEQTEHLDRLQGLVESLTTRQHELRQSLHDTHTQLFERDEEIERLRAELRERDSQLERERRRLRNLQGSRWWRLRQTIARVVGR